MYVCVTIDDAGSLRRRLSHDTAGRLDDVDLNGSAYANYVYDQNSNRTSLTQGGSTTTSTYDNQDRLLTRGVWDYDYNLNGQLEAKTDTGTSATTAYDYDALGNLDSVDLPNTSNNVAYLTDGFGHRVAKKVGGVLEQGWLYGPGASGPMAELDDQGAVVSRFVYATSATVPDYMVKSGTTYRIVKDQLGSPRLVVNAATGSVAQEIEYGPFGEVIADSNPGFQPFGFAGGLYDHQTGLVRFGARDYDATTGRWTATDPISFAGGQANLYGYVINDPVNLVDPSGLSLLDDVFGVDGIIDDVVPDAVSEASAGVLDGAAFGLPSAAFGIDPDCWGDAHNLGQFGGAIGAGLLTGGATAAGFAARTGVGAFVSGGFGGAVGGVWATLGLNPSATLEEIAAGALLGIPGGAAGAGLAHLAGASASGSAVLSSAGGVIGVGIKSGSPTGPPRVPASSPCGC